MSNVTYRFMEHFRQRPADEQLKVFKQNLKQMEGEEAVDLPELINACRKEIKLNKQYKIRNNDGTS